MSSRGALLECAPRGTDGPALMHLRDVIVQILRASDRPMGAYDIAKRISQIKGQKCHANSVYRVLDPMIRSGEIQSIVTERSYAFTAQKPCSLLWCICRNCKAILPLNADAIHQSLDEAARSCSFQPAQRHVELVGLCANCAAHSRGLTM